MATTMLKNLINPEVMADMISAKIPAKLVVAPIAKVDTTLQGNAGDTITVPRYAYIGDAEDVAEGVTCGTSVLTATSSKVTVKKAMKAVELTDEAVLSGYGNPEGEATNQLSKAIASKEDSDALDVIVTVAADESENGVQLVYDGSAKVIGYAGLVDAIDLFEEEVNSEKVTFVHPKQVTQLRKDSDFISADKYDNNVVMTGEIGRVANSRIVPSKKVPLSEDGTCYLNPIVKLNNDAETEDDAPAITIYMKKAVNVETERDTLARKTIISVDQHYVAALTNTSKVVLAKFKK